MSDQPQPRPKGSQLAAREEQLRKAVERHEAAAAAPEPTEAEVNAAGTAWFRGEVDRLRSRRPTARRREPGS